MRAARRKIKAIDAAGLIMKLPTDDIYESRLYWANKSPDCPHTEERPLVAHLNLKRYMQQVANH